MIRLLLLVSLIVTCGACATPMTISCNEFDQFRKKLPNLGLHDDIQGTEPKLREDFNPLVAEIRSAIAQKNLSEENHAALLLSGGGQWGAFGAGFLNALHAKGELPDFPVVTGVSTGGLQSMFVATNFYPSLIEAYSPNREDEVVDRRPKWTAVFTGGIAGLKPLRRRIRHYLCSDLDSHAPCLLDALRALPEDRKVLIGFVEARSGDFYYVNAADLARIPDRHQARECLTGAALASSAMPVFFQQVRIGGRTYYDGGVRQSVFDDQVAKAVEILSRQSGQSLPIYVVRNGPTTLDPDTDPDESAAALTNAFRAEAIVVNELEVGSIAALRLHRPTGAIRLVTADGWEKFIEDRPCKKGEGVMFDPDFMGCLRAFGAQRAAEPWASLREIAKSAPSGGEAQ